MFLFCFSDSIRVYSMHNRLNILRFMENYDILDIATSIYGVHLINVL